LEAPELKKFPEERILGIRPHYPSETVFYLRKKRNENSRGNGKRSRKK
jgi:hypothetical protein